MRLQEFLSTLDLIYNPYNGFIRSDNDYWTCMMFIDNQVQLHGDENDIIDLEKYNIYIDNTYIIPTQDILELIL